MESIRVTFAVNRFARRSVFNRWRCETQVSRGVLNERISIRAYTKDAIAGPAKKDITAAEHETSSRALPAPHSLLPTKMLVRAALVSTISSRPYLLDLALRTLTFLSSTKIGLLRVDRNPLIHLVLKQTFYNHFCAGENGKEVSSTIRNLKDIGFKGVILTYAREIVVDSSLEEKGKGTLDAEKGVTDKTQARSPDIDSWKDGVLLTVSLLSEGDFLALKMTGAGASVMKSLSSSSRSVPKQMAEALDEVCTAALRRNVKILVDAEQQSIQKGIDAVAIDLMRKYNTDGKTIVYNTYQAYLKSTPDTLRTHMETASSENFALGVKLVRGAYIASEPRHLIHDTKADTDKCYDGIAEGLLKQTYPIQSASKSYPSTALFLATHNKDSAISALQLHRTETAAGRPTPNVQYGQLLGMADEVSCTLLQMGQSQSQSAEKAAAPEVYKCLSWGPLEDCLSYLLRRARENKDAVARSRAECIAVWTELLRRTRSPILKTIACFCAFAVGWEIRNLVGR